MGDHKPFRRRRQAATHRRFGQKFLTAPEGRWHVAIHDPGLTAEQVAFGRAMVDLKRRLGRQPSEAEVLREAVRLGYRKTTER